MYLYFYLTYNNYKIFKCGILSRKHIAIKGFLFYSLFNYIILYTLPCVLIINFCILYKWVPVISSYFVVSLFIYKYLYLILLFMKNVFVFLSNL